MISTAHITHIPNAVGNRDTWSPFVVGGVVAGEAHVLPLGGEAGEGTFENAALWRHDGGKLAYARPTSTELMLLIEGRVRISDAHSETVEASAGDVVIVPRGFAGVWHTLDPILKMSVSVS